MHKVHILIAILMIFALGCRLSPSINFAPIISVNWLPTVLFPQPQKNFPLHGIDIIINLMAQTAEPTFLLSVAQGSATVALTTTAALIAPVVAATSGLSELDLCFIVIAIAGGATVLSHFNDSGFWLVLRLLEMDEKTTLKTWTVMETFLGTITFIIVTVLSMII